MTTHVQTMPRPPILVRLGDRLARPLLAAGLPMGPNTLLRIRGRTSGEPRTVAVAVTEIDGRRYVVGTFGEVHWVRNLRVAGEAEVRVGGRFEPVAATELSEAEGAAFFGRLLEKYVYRVPRRPVQILTRAFLRFLAPEILDDPARAAQARPVFELAPGRDPGELTR